MTDEKNNRTGKDSSLSRRWRGVCAQRSLLLPLLFAVFLAAILAPKAQAQLPPGNIVYSHEDSGSPDPAQKFYNVWSMNAQDPTQQVQITSFASAPIMVSTPVFSKDFSQVAFTSNFNDGLSSLEEDSIYSIYPDGSNLQQITGFGVLNPLPPPTGTVMGRVQATGGALQGCIASVQGAPQSVDCGDGTFQITDVPVGSAWVRVQGFVVGPGLELGFAPISVIPGGMTDAGTITIRPEIPKSIEPSWSRDGTQIIVTNEVTGRRFVGGQWVPFFTHELRVWSADGQFVRAIPNPTGLESFGSDWSPVADKIAFAAAGSSAGQSYVKVADPDGTNPQTIYQVPLPFDGVLRIVTYCRWSPDGQHIAFAQLASRFSDGASWSDLYVINADGTGLAPLILARPGAFALVPTWSPDGQAMAFEGDLGPDLLHLQSYDIYAFNLGGTVGQLTTDGRSSGPSWGPPM